MQEVIGSTPIFSTILHGGRGPEVKMKVSNLKPQPSNQESFFDILTHKTVSKDFIFESKLSRLRM